MDSSCHRGVSVTVQACQVQHCRPLLRSALCQFPVFGREPFCQFLVFQTFTVAGATEFDDQVYIVRGDVTATDITVIVALRIKGTHCLCHGNLCPLNRSCCPRMGGKQVPDRHRDLTSPKSGVTVFSYSNRHTKAHSIPHCFYPMSFRYVTKNRPKKLTRGTGRFCRGANLPELVRRVPLPRCGG